MPHVHVHVIPRLKADFGGETDNVYPALEDSEWHLEGDLARHEDHGVKVGGIEAAIKRKEGWQVPPDEERKPRSDAEMAKEAQWLQGLLGRAK